MTLLQYDEQWAGFIESAQCPPLPGLVPLSEQEFVEIGRLVNEELRTRPTNDLQFRSLLSLLSRYPAGLVIFLAHVASRAYSPEDGSFWPPFRATVGVEIHPSERKTFVNQFRQCCFRAGFRYEGPRPGDVGPRQALLFHAGLPIEFAENFARSIRWVEGNFSLPSPEDAGAGEVLQSLILKSPYLANIPNLRRSLEGPGGAIICETALRVAFDAVPPKINPGLQDRIAKALQGLKGERPEAPYVRLSPDLSCLQLVCPGQRKALVGYSGLILEVDGTRHVAGVNDPRIFAASITRSHSVTIRGFRNRTNLCREFDLQLTPPRPPFLVFSGTTHRCRLLPSGNEFELPRGDYYILHSTGAVWTNRRHAEEWIEPDEHGNPLTLSQISLSPQRSVVEAAIGQEKFTFKVVLSPIFLPDGSSVKTDDDEPIHYGWSCLPEIRCPKDDACSETWTLHLKAGELEHTIPLSQATDVEGMDSFQPGGADWLTSLPPGLWLLELSVSKISGRKRHTERFYYWSGLASYAEGETFTCRSWPSNLRPEQSTGFLRSGQDLIHEKDQRRCHTLTFDWNDRQRSFSFRRSGLFLELVDAHPGKPERVEAAELGVSLTITPQSSQWLRLWFTPALEFALEVNGFQQETSNGQSCIRLSLATLSTAYPYGEITVKANDLVFKVASFSRSLAPREARDASNLTHARLVFSFAENLHSVRPRMTELVSGRTFAGEGQTFGATGRCSFTFEALPPIECGHFDPHQPENDNGFPLCFSAPKAGWPSGVWLIELEIRARADGAWQRLQDERGGGFPIAILNAEDSSGGIRAIAWWAAYRNVDVAFGPAEGAHLGALLSDISDLLSRGFHALAWSRIKTIEKVFFELGRLVGPQIVRDDQLGRNFLAAVGNQIAENPTRSLFVEVPELFALQPGAYADLPEVDSLRTALRWCARLSRRQRVADSLADVFDALLNDFEIGCLNPPGLIGILQRFQNFGAATKSQGGDDFRRFQFQLYRDQTIGVIDARSLREHTSFEPLPFDWLTGQHARWALSSLLGRRANPKCNVITAASSVRDWVKNQLGAHSQFLAPQAWLAPWLITDLPVDFLTDQLNCYASMVALTARASASGWIRLSDLLVWQTETEGVQASIRATTTLVAMCPELFGFYLVLWELLIRTGSPTTPHA